MVGIGSTLLKSVDPPARSLELLVQTGLLLSQERDLRKIVQAATDAGRELCGAQFGAFFYNVIDARGESYLLYTLSGAPPEAFAQFPMPRNTAVFAPTFSGESVVRSGDITADPRYGQNAPRAGMPPGHLPVRSYLAVPVVSHSGEVLGGLFYGHAECDVFAEESEGLVQTVAAQAAIAIENFRLREELTRKIEDVEVAQRQQQKEAQHVREVLETTSDAVLLLDSNWIVRFINLRAEQLIAQQRELLGKNIWDLFPEAVGSIFQQQYELVMADRQPREFVEYFSPLASWYAIRAYPAEDGIIIFFRDITRELEDERALQENARRLRLALDAGHFGTWSWNATTDGLDLDQRASEILDWTAHQPVTRSEMRDRIVLDEDRALTTEALQRTVETGAPYDAEYRVHRTDGTITWVTAHGVPLFDGGHPRSVTGMIGTIQDITARKMQEQALRQTEKLAATGRMAATIAHEINNPLEAVANLIYLARHNDETPLEVQKQLEVADQELRRVSQIAQQTLGFYRDTSQPALFDVETAAREVIAVFQRKLQYKQLQCTLDVRGPLHFRGIQGEIRQAISNLLVNAIDASPSPGTVVLRIRKTSFRGSGSSAVSIMIGDRGAGIPHAARPQLFAPFFTTKLDLGTGLGLWVTKGIIEKHGGSIRFRTRAEGATGTIFRILLPLSSGAAQA